MYSPYYSLQRRWRRSFLHRLLHAIEQTQRRGHRRVDPPGSRAAVASELTLGATTYEDREGDGRAVKQTLDWVARPPSSNSSKQREKQTKLELAAVPPPMMMVARRPAPSTHNL